MADLAINSAATVLKSGSGVAVWGVTAAATTITAGCVLYLLANNTIGLASANGVSPANAPIGIALHASSPGQPIKYVTTDPVLTIGATTAAFAAGDPIYLSATAGRFTATKSELAGLDPDAAVIVLGVALSATTINFAPIVGGTVS